MEPAMPLRRKIDHELMIAANVQTHLLPKEIPNVPGYEVHAYYKPCDFIGGDYYDFIQIDKNNIGIAIADISGKGVPAALMMVETRAFLRSEAKRSLSTKEVLSKLNESIQRDMPKGMFVTVFYAILDTKEHKLKYSSCGHDPMAFYRSSDDKLELINTKGLALGIMDNRQFDIDEQSIKIMSKDFFVLYTDGVADTHDEKKEFYNRIANTSNSQDLMKTIIKGIDAKSTLKDDSAIVLVKRV